MCIDVLDTWFGIANGQILQMFDRAMCLPLDSSGVLLFDVLLRLYMYLYPLTDNNLFS